MRPPHLLGIAITIVLAAAVYLVPRYFPATSGATARGLEQAELARRELSRHNIGLSELGRRADPGGLKEAELDQLLERAGEAFDALRREFAETVHRARAADRSRGRPDAQIQPPGMHAAGLRSAIGSFGGALDENRSLLDQASRDARAAYQAAGQVRGVAQIQGMTELLRASELLAEARMIRGELEAKLAELLGTATEWKRLQGETDHYEGLDADEILARLSADLKQVKASYSASAAEAVELAQAVQERRQALAQARAGLEQARALLLDLQEQGFTAGDDASFGAYRRRYLEITRQQQRLQEQEQLLAAGGIEGGEPVLGLEELQRRLENAREKQRRWTNAVRALEQQSEYVQRSGRAAQTRAGEYALRVDGLRAEIDRLKEQLKGLATAAIEKEEQARRLALNGVRAFGDAQSAVDTWVREARDLKRSKDPKGTNERLDRIVRDEYAQFVGADSEAGARLLLGRLFAERSTGISLYLDGLDRLAAVVPGITPDREHRQQQETAAQTAAEEGVKVLNEARGTYESLTRGPAATAWISYAALANVDWLLSKLDTSQAAMHLANARESIGKAVAGREKSPYVAAHLKFRDHLGVPSEEGFELEEQEPRKDANEPDEG